MNIASTSLENWPRPHYEGGGPSPFLFYVVFGCDADKLSLSRSKYRCDGIPDHIELMTYTQEEHPEVLADFRDGYLWNELLESDPGLAKSIAAQTRCAVIRGSVIDEESLNYFRNTIGLLTCLLDTSGVAILDMLSLKWWSSSAWRADVFEPAAALPAEHVMLLVSDEAPGMQMLHTRGLAKFGRPDLSIHRVPQSHRRAVVELFNRLIEFQAFGGVIAEEQEIKMQSLPAGMYCRHRGNEDDPDFNNFHVEISWPD